MFGKKKKVMCGLFKKTWIFHSKVKEISVKSLNGKEFDLGLSKLTHAGPWVFTS